MEHLVLNTGKYGKLRLLQITCRASLLAGNYPHTRQLAIFPKSQIIAGWVKSVKSGSGRCSGKSSVPSCHMHA
eukprot:s992_g2.t1